MKFLVSLEVNAIPKQLNEGPRKMLSFQMPAEIFSESVVSTPLNSPPKVGISTHAHSVGVQA